VLAEIDAKLGPGAVAGARRMADWTRLHADRVHFNTHPTWGSMGPMFARGGQPFYPFLIHSDGMLGIYFQYMIGRPVFGALEMRQDLLRRLNEIPGVSLSESALTKRPLVSLQVFASKPATDQFLAVMDWFVEQLPPRGGAANGGGLSPATNRGPLPAVQTPEQNDDEQAAPDSTAMAAPDHV
jgi:hypothetical protein